MTPSILELFRIGIGPSSSHTVGPMRAARAFVAGLAADGRLEEVGRVEVELYGSLALTGRGHGTDRAVLLGLAGETPDGVEPEAVERVVAAVHAGRRIELLGRRPVAFDPATDLRFRGDVWLPGHPNALRLAASGPDGDPIAARTYFSVGGGVVLDEDGRRVDAATGGHGDGDGAEHGPPVPFPFATADDLLRIGREHGLRIDGIVLANEDRRETGVREGIDRVWSVMSACIDRGLKAEGMLPGGLGVPRRAPALWRSLEAGADLGTGAADLDAADGVGTGARPGDGAARPADPLHVMDRATVWAMAVNEENAAGGRVVTAPTNGAAGLLPAVARYYERHVPGADRAGIRRLFLAAGAIGLLCRENASISGAEVGCQGEVGVAASMAAAGLAAALGGSNEQVENAAEIALEHHLGMTCDPVGGLVQIPCIERNGLGAVKAISSARMALRGDGSHRVSLDQAIATMLQTGRDMASHYKETAQGGLAVNVPDC